ncbi:3-deoxy-7-phosphoheptulonate synthase class II [Brooklawnia cerclae]|uniref:Phospho-2-dehydro-3-deoxyheptonate aldolase n=1 Tax=Brooklawnia cerclae TaxID=349934 RepID=A0ABX0SGM1_9ACTN|nr:3-deoxy-7-phosphoheptulonate synthase [Brooklawnia cerclae]
MSDLIPSLSELHSLPQVQQPSYDDPDRLRWVVNSLRQLPPLVFAGECDELRDKIALVADRKAFMLQGGDCAETFASVQADNIKAKLRVLLAMSVVMTYGAQLPVVKVGRIAGQYAKPRSKDTETRDGLTLPAYRGDAVNGFDFNDQARRHDPDRLLRVYNASAATLNLVRAFVKGGFADLRQLHAWNASFVKDSRIEERYEQLAGEIERALGFMLACGVNDDTLTTVDFYASHEALLLDYEYAMTRIDSRSQLPYDTSGHMVWIGERTRQPGGAQVELLRRVRNPLGIKLGPTATGEDALSIADRLDPDREPGRITFITRMGAEHVREKLPRIIETVEKSGRKVAWVCDPMHGNTFETHNGYKTREYAAVVEELNGFFDVHDELGSWPGGVHVELTGEDVTECLGGAFQLSEEDLDSRYETACDPRLNRNQSLELAFMISERLSQSRALRREPVQVPDWNA